MKKIFILAILLLLFCYPVFNVELGGIIGNVTNPDGLIYGVSVGSGIIIPMIKFEVELLNINNSEYKSGGLAVKFRPRLGRIAPYIVAGVGVEFKNFIDFNKNNYLENTFYGTGFYYYFNRMFSIRVDYRAYNFSNHTKSRITGGFFVNL